MTRHDFSNFDLPGDVYADAIGGVDDLGENFRVIFIAFGRGAGGVLVPQPVLCVVRPKSSMLIKDGAISKMLQFSEKKQVVIDDGMRMYS